MAELTYVEYQSALERGAIGLWSLGVMEEHGPHLPLGTDIYVGADILRRVQRRLEAAGLESIILPPFCWGVNDVTRMFPGSIEVQRETVIRLLDDVLTSLRRDGLRRVYCISGHLDTSHLRAVIAGVAAAAYQPGGGAWFVTTPALLERVGDTDGAECVLLTADDPMIAGQHVGLSARHGFIDIHAGGGETSSMLAIRPGLVRQHIMAGLPPTDLEFSDLVEWRKAGDAVMRLTPDGYFGDPASATAGRGEAFLETQARLTSDAILYHIRNQPTT